MTPLMKSLVRVVAGLVVLAAIATVLRGRGWALAPVLGGPSASTSVCVSDRDGCQTNSDDPERAPSDVVFESDEVCIDAGYLCSDVQATGSTRLLRWPSETRRLRILVPLPEESDRAYSRDLQRAAVRGIRSWHGKPFPLVVETRAGGEPPNVLIRWNTVLGDGQLGVTHSRWQQVGDVVTFEILGLELATRRPHEPTRTLTGRQVALTAAHEMGHALGLPHSDRESDVMFPINTANALSARDFRTMEAMYRLPNGAEIRKPQ